MSSENIFAKKSLPVNFDYVAPDGSEIRLLSEVSGGGLCHCMLPVDGVSGAVCHKTVEEIWYFVAGVGELWRKHGELEDVLRVCPGVSVSITPGMKFQFRNCGSEPLCFIDATMPPWPGPDEAVPVEGKWKPTLR